MSYLRSSFTSVASRPWWSNGAWMSTCSIFASRSTRSHRSLKNYHNITMLEYLPSMQIDKNMDLAISSCGTYSGSCRAWTTDCTLVTSRTLRGKEGWIWVKILKTLGDCIFNIRSKNMETMIKYNFFLLYSPHCLMPSTISNKPSIPFLISFDMFF